MQMIRYYFLGLRPLPRPVFVNIARVCSGGVAAAGSIGMMGWLLDIAPFRSIVPGLATMKLNTAACFIASGLTLWLLNSTHTAPLRRNAMAALSTGVGLIGILTLLQYAFGADFGIDQRVIADLHTAPDAFPGRMSPAAALCFTWIAAAYLCLLRRYYRLGQFFAALTAFGSLLALMGHLFDVTPLYSTLIFSTMVLHTTLAFIALSIGILAATSDQGFMAVFNEDGPGGTLARWMLPAAALLPIILGWMIEKGMRAGSYDLAFTFDLLILSSMITFTSLVVWTTYAVRHADQSRQKAVMALRRRNREYRTLSACNQALVRATEESLLLNQVCQLIVEVGGYVAAWFGYAEEAGSIRPFSVSVSANLADARPEPACIQALTLQSLRTVEPQIMNTRVTNTPECAAEAARLGYVSVAALPVSDKNALFGVLHVYAQEPDAFGSVALELLNELTGDLGFGIQTIRVRAAHESAERRIRYQASLLENVSDAVIATDLDFRVLSWNEAAHRIYGWEEHEVIGQPVNSVLRTQASEESLMEMVESLRQNGDWQGEVIQHHRNGESLTIQASVSLLTGPDGQEQGVVAVNRDISEYAAMREKLLQAELERVAFEKERELLVMKEGFIATVSHDFRAPLAVILSSSELLKLYEEKLNSEKRLNHLTRIHDQARYMTALLDDVLSFSKARAGRFAYDPVTMNLIPFCREIFEQMQDNGTPEHRFVFASQGDLHAALMDTQILRRVFTNLLSNAIKYSPQGGEVRFEVRRDGENVIFMVCDEGIGIPADDLPHIFDPFQRASNARSYQGTGLGMPIVYEHVTLLGGNIEIDSEEGRGTKVTVCLPYRKERLSETDN